jgi:DNA-binding response OmpR family regulator
MDATGCAARALNSSRRAMAGTLWPQWFLWPRRTLPMMCSVMGHHREPWMAHRAATASAPELAWPPPSHLVLLVARARAPQRSVVDCLAQRGLRCIWVDGLHGLQGVAHQVVPDALVFDAQAEGTPLPAALAQLRQWFAGTLLVLDGYGDEVDEILALELSADGLLAHPVSPRRLRARLEALLRRHPAAADAPPLPAADAPADLPAGWRLDAVLNRLRRGAQTVELSSGQIHLLRCLALHAGRVVPRAELHEQVCAPESDLRARSIDVYVHRLRQRLLAAGVSDLRIEAVRGRGFVLKADAALPLEADHGAAPDATAPRGARAAAYLNS